MSELKANWIRYISGLIVGAILVLGLGFTVGPLTTNGSAAILATQAATERDIAFCAAEGLRSIASGKVKATEDFWGRIVLARDTIKELLPDQETTRAVIGGCAQAFPGAPADLDATYWLDGVPRNSNR